MRHRSNVSPVPLPVGREKDVIVVEYLDGRVVRYRGPAERRDGPVRATVSFEVHVLVVDDDRGEGVMVYVNDYDTADDILESTGVGRVLLGENEAEMVYPGVTVERGGESVEVSLSDDPPRETVFVFVESEVGERAFELV